tara:strand:- start:199283 stop:200461 length:1179 start_codon:yes stop_codon:yes gene_type:complete
MAEYHILFVDDDSNLLMALRRQLRGKFEILTAAGGTSALKMFEEHDTIAVCVADMQMPNMNGLEFLEKIKKISPDTVRIMLTGNADQATAVDAINKGHIFRFFSKPYETADLERALSDGLRQHQLITAEKTLIQETLAGSVKLLIDVMAQLNPTVFGRSMKMKGWCDSIAKELEYPRPWELGIAALLCPIGIVALPPDILARLALGKPLQPLEKDLLRRTPEVGHKLISNIPRLEAVADMVLLQNRNFDGSGFPESGPSGENIPLGARILRIARDLADVGDGPEPTDIDFEVIGGKPHRYDPVLLSKIRTLLAVIDGEQEFPPEGLEMRVRIDNLREGDLLMTDLETMEDHVVLTHGNFISQVQLARIRVFQKAHDFREPVEVKRGVKRKST